MMDNYSYFTDIILDAFYPYYIEYMEYCYRQDKIYKETGIKVSSLYLPENHFEQVSNVTRELNSILGGHFDVRMIDTKEIFKDNPTLSEKIRRFRVVKIDDFYFDIYSFLNDGRLHDCPDCVDGVEKCVSEWWDENPADRLAINQFRPDHYDLGAMMKEWLGSREIFASKVEQFNQLMLLTSEAPGHYRKWLGEDAASPFLGLFEIDACVTWDAWNEQRPETADA